MTISFLCLFGFLLLSWTLLLAFVQCRKLTAKLRTERSQLSTTLLHEHPPSPGGQIDIPSPPISPCSTAHSIASRDMMRFSTWRFFGALAKGAIAWLGGILILFLFSFILNLAKGETMSALISERGFGIVRLILAVCFSGGFFLGGRYIRLFWKHAPKTIILIIDMLRSVAIGAVLGGSFTLLSAYVISPLLSKALHVLYDSPLNPVDIFVVGAFAALAVMGFGYFVGEDKDAA